MIDGVLRVRGYCNRCGLLAWVAYSHNDDNSIVIHGVDHDCRPQHAPMINEDSQHVPPFERG
jgi:hypothetical protein